MNRSKVIFFGSRNSKFSDGLFYSLVKTNCDIVAVVNSPEGKLESTSGKKTAEGYTEMAMDMGIPCFAPDKPNSPEFAEQLRAYPCDAFILGGYAMLVKSGLLELPKKRIAINFHASLLPDYKGKHPVFWAIRHGEKQCGITAHHLNDKLDEGSIAYQEAVDIGEGSVADVYEKVLEKCADIMPKLVDAINADIVPVIPQKGEGSYYSSITDEDYVIDFALGADRNKWAVQATPGKCYFETPKGKIYAYSAATGEATDAENGTLVYINKDFAEVASKKSIIKFTLLSLDAQQKPAGELLLSLGYKTSDRL